MLQDIKVRVKFDTIGNFGTCQSFSTGCNITLRGGRLSHAVTVQIHM